MLGNLKKKKKKEQQQKKNQENTLHITQKAKHENKFSLIPNQDNAN